LLTKSKIWARLQDLPVIKITVRAST